MSEPARPGEAAGAGVVVGIDVGGTFTDVCALDERTGELRVAKVPSVRGREADGFLAGLAEVVPSPGAASTIMHGTTVGTNALLERKTAPAGLITTEGFGDVLEMRRRDRPRTWGLWGDFEPTIPRDRRLEVAERVLADGTVLVEVDSGEVVEQARALVAGGAEACCIAFLNAYANPANERRALDAVRAVWPNEYVTAAHAILPEIREFERTSTVALNAGLQPVVGGYLASLEAALAERGFRGRFFLVQSNGGALTAEAARALPVRTALSGPAAGVIACSHLAAAAGYDNVITCDMGGTSFDVAVVAGGRSIASAQTSIDFGLVIPDPDDRDIHDRRRRRFHRPPRRGWAAAGGAGVGGVGAGPGVLRGRRGSPDGHRRPLGAGDASTARRRSAAWIRSTARLPGGSSPGTSPSRSGWASRPPPRPSSTSPRVPWRGRSAWCPSSGD